MVCNTVKCIQLAHLPNSLSSGHFWDSDKYIYKNTRKSYIISGENEGKQK